MYRNIEEENSGKQSFDEKESSSSFIDTGNDGQENHVGPQSSEVSIEEESVDISIKSHDNVAGAIQTIPSAGVETLGADENEMMKVLRRITRECCHSDLDKRPSAKKVLHWINAVCPKSLGEDHGDKEHLALMERL